MYIITDAYFTRELEIPNINEADSKEFTKLESFIDDKCRLFMLELLGQENLTSLEGYLVNGLLPVDVSGVPEKWLNLLKGCTYTKDDKSYKWKGLYFTEGSYKGSILAYFTYYFWLMNEVSFMSGVGEVKSQPKGALMVNSTQRLVNAWNTMVRMNQQNLDGNLPYIEGCNFYYNYGWCQNYSNNCEVSLMQFMNDNIEDYPNANRKYYRIQNQLGL